MQPPPPPNPPPYGSPPLPYGNQPPRKGMPAWGWALLGCGCLSLLIVPILAAILFPVFAKSRERAREMVCLSNEKQMSLALLQYSQDFDEKLPVQPDWMDVTAPYRAGADRMLHCPTAAGQDPNQYGYAFNSGIRGRNIVKIPRPETVPMVYDSSSLGRNATDAVSSLPSPPRHGTGNNIAYADGHVKSARTGAGP